MGKLEPKVYITKPLEELNRKERLKLKSKFLAEITELGKKADIKDQKALDALGYRIFIPFKAA